MMVCEHCGKDLTQGAKFCGHCGASAPQGTDTAQTIYSDAPQDGYQPGQQTAPRQQGAYQPGQQTAPQQQGVYQPGQQTAPQQQGVYQPGQQTAPQQQGVYQPEQQTAPRQQGVYQPGQQTAPRQQGVYQPGQQTAPRQQGAYQPQSGYISPAGQPPYIPPGQQYGAQSPYGGQQTMIKQKRPLNKKLLLLGGIGIAIVAIIVILLFAFIGRKDPYTGTWIGVKIEAEGVLLDTREAFDDDIFIDINDDGMCVLTSGDEKVNGEWEKEKGGILIKADGFTLHCRVKGNTMIIENYADSGMTLTLEKVSGSAGKTSAQLNDPNAGVWHVVSAEIWGIKTDIRDVFENGFSVELLEKGKCKLNVNGIIADGQWTLKDGVITIKGGGLDTSGTLRDGLLFLENVMGIGLDLSFRKDGIPEDTEIADGGFQSPTTTIDEDSYWYGMVILSNIVPAVDANEMEGPHDVWGYVGTDSGGRAFFEVYDTPHMDEFPILSTYIDLYSDSFAADIGYEDAWLFDDYLDASANVFFSPGLDNGALNISYYFQGEDLSFDFTLFLREDGAPWDMENDTLPPGYDNYYGLSGEDGDWDEEELMPAEFLTMAQLREAYDFMEPSGMTYEEVRDLFLGGVDGEVVPKDDPDLKGYVWRSQEDPAKAMWITYKKNSAGKYVYTSRSIQGVP